MNEKLKELRKIMITSELRDVKFGNKNKEYVFNSINSNKKKHRRVNDWIPRSLSIVMISGFIFASLVFAKEYILKPDSSQNSHYSQSETNERNMSSDSTDNTEEEIKNEDSEVLTKEETQLLMLNTLHHFKTAKGLFINESKNHKETVEYQVSLIKDEIGSYIKTNLDMKNQDLNEETDKKDTDKTEIFNGDKILQLNNESKKYQVSDAALSFNRDSKITLDEVYKETEDGSPVYRNHPFAGSAASSLYPYGMATNFLKDHDKWEIEKQSSTLLDKNVIIIKGSLNDDDSDKYNASSFRFWVERQTGILLKMELYKDDQVVESLVTKELELNKTIDKNKFSIAIPEGYTLDK
ncbi:hypothetical protein CU633_07955 [Bacillus sp. V3-13]|uniref:sigma-E factor regulatory protein RseB domain-containing protein n=1 Tax=Bacillus sp. V3-13 TaxID=2053728 RepID=UPI000C75C781|nr:hypothetical protein [Bacillus sp. V3-13]PLR77950.1 hypothetical protein CU633_07955 [Bacillus sp. V3-13]